MRTVAALQPGDKLGVGEPRTDIYQGVIVLFLPDPRVTHVVMSVQIAPEPHVGGLHISRL